MLSTTPVPPAAAAPKGRQWIYARQMKGRLYRYRNLLGYVLLALLFAGPFITLNQEQLVLLNVLERKFVFFGVVFMPQDFYLFVLAMLTFMVFIILFTVLFGRIWCGWACPQTIFMEMIFRKIEYWIEGDAQQQKKLNAAPANAGKVLKKTAKHLIFLLISFLIANVFLAYIIGSGALLAIMREPVALHISGFLSICLFTLIFYVVFAYIRELVCTVICPYGRLQGVLIDRKTLVVAYDYVRGEPRGHLKKADTAVKGDCVDCGLCVQVCPTGIDIRRGTQAECINCTLCIDACNGVMDKIDRPVNLIGFKSEEQISDGRPFSFGKRIYGYAAILLILATTLGVLLLKRQDVDTSVLRASGTLYQLRDDGTVSNLYNAVLINKTSENIPFTITVSDPLARIQYINNTGVLNRGSDVKLTFFIILPQKSIKHYNTGITLKVVSKGRTAGTAATTFIAPPNQ